MEQKKGILVVSFGTSHLDTLERTITAVEQYIAAQFPEYRVYRAFTSGMILRKLKRKENLTFDNVEEALERMAADGIETAVIQPTHVINGIENDRMLEAAEAYRDRFETMQIGAPLLSTAEDYKKAVHAVMAEVDPAEDETLIMPIRHTRRWNIRFICSATVRYLWEPWRDFRICRMCRRSWRSRDVKKSF